MRILKAAGDLLRWRETDCPFLNLKQCDERCLKCLVSCFLRLTFTTLSLLVGAHSGVSSGCWVIMPCHGTLKLPYRLSLMQCFLQARPGGTRWRRQSWDWWEGGKFVRRSACQGVTGKSLLCWYVSRLSILQVQCMPISSPYSVRGYSSKFSCCNATRGASSYLM